MNHLRRELAPISDAAWAEIDDEARRALPSFLAGRQIVDFTGPLGWDHAAVPTGRTELLPASPGGSEAVRAARRTVQPLVELRVELTLSRDELDAIDRGAADADLGAVVEAARKIARAEDTMIFEGFGADATGIATGSPHAPIQISDDYTEFPQLVASAVVELRRAGVEGPYAVALGPVCHLGVIEGTGLGGYPVLEHLKLITGGPLVLAPAVDGTVVVSMRGGDHELVVGQDLSIGYLDHDADTVTLYLEESIAFRNLAPEAAVALRYPG